MKASEVRNAVAGAIGEIALLDRGLGDGIDDDGIPMTSTLYAVEHAIAALRRARTKILRHERERGVSWGEITQATGVPSSTWRNRHKWGAEA